MDTELGFEEKQMLTGLERYITRLVRHEMSLEKEEFRAEVKKSIDYIVQRTNELNKIAKQFDKYITTGGEIKDMEKK